MRTIDLIPIDEPAGREISLIPVDDEPAPAPVTSVTLAKKGLLESVGDAFTGAGARMAQGVNESLGGINKAIGVDSTVYDEGADYWKKKAEAVSMDGLPGKIYEGIGTAPVGVAEFMAGPIYAGAKGGLTGYQEDGVTGAAKGASFEAIKRYGLGKIFHALGNTELTQLPKAAAMGGTMGIQTAAEQAMTPEGIQAEDVAAAAATGTLLSINGGGKSEVIRQQLVKEGVQPEIASDLATRTPAVTTGAKRDVTLTPVEGETGTPGNVKPDIPTDQQAFIRDQVETLGSLEAVQKMHGTDTPADVYARQIAGEIYKTDNPAVPGGVTLEPVRENLGTLEKSAVAAGVTDTGARAPGFLDAQGVLGKEIVDAHAKGELTPEFFQEKLAGLSEDRVTGYQGATLHRPTLELAWQEHKGSERDFSYADIDLANLGGLNAHRGSNEKANADFRAISAIIREEVSKDIPDARFFRQGGDEISVIAPDASREVLDSALARAQGRVQQYAVEQGLDQVPHPKDKPESPHAPGVGIHYGTADFLGKDSPHDVIISADRATASMKEQKGVDYVQRSKGTEIGNQSLVESGEVRAPEQSSEGRPTEGIGSPDKQGNPEATGSSLTSKASSLEVTYHPDKRVELRFSTPPDQKTQTRLESNRFKQTADNTWTAQGDGKARRAFVDTLQKAPIDTPATVVKEAVTTARQEGTPLKEQKKFLLANIADAIKTAPDALPEGGTGRTEVERARSLEHTVTIDVPDDGTFEVVNTKATLEAFKKNVEKMFPTSIRNDNAPAWSPTDRPNDSGSVVAREVRKAVELYGDPLTAYEKMQAQLDKGGMEFENDAHKKNTERVLATLKSQTEQLQKTGQPAETSKIATGGANGIQDKDTVSPVGEVKAGATEVSGTVAPETTPTKIDDFGVKIGGARKDLSYSSGTQTAKPKSDVPAWQRRYVSMQDAKSGKWSVIDKETGRPMGRLTFDTQAKADSILPAAVVALKHRVRQESDGTYKIIRNVTDRKRVTIKDGFETEAYAMKYMAENAKAIIETNTTFGEEIIARPERVFRTGAERRQGDTASKDFTDAFAFRGVEFGKWNNQAERQEVMNHAYDGLLDLAEILHLPAKAISLNGELSLAFGARGQGLSGAKAHYEPGYSVINLTKMSGSGSLAHEWFHALDNYFARQDGKAKSEKVQNKRGDMVYPAEGGGKDMVTSGFRVKSGVREEVRTAFKELIDTIYYKAEQYVEDTAKAEKFVGSAARGLETKLGEIRDYMARQREYGSKKGAATPEQLARFDELAAKLATGEDIGLEWRTGIDAKPGAKPTDRGSWGHNRWTNDTVEEISKLYKAVTGRSGFSAEHKGTLNYLVGSVRDYANRRKLLEEAANQDVKTKKVPTSYRMESYKIDQGRTSDYWTLEHEMAARAFSSYVEDMVAARGNKSDFLSYGSDNNLPWYRLFNVRPFPEGTERTAINQAFDKLLGTIRTRETETGSVILDNMGLQQLYERLAKTKIVKDGMEDLKTLARHVYASGAQTWKTFVTGMKEALGKHFSRFRPTLESMWKVVNNERGSVELNSGILKQTWDGILRAANPMDRGELAQKTGELLRERMGVREMGRKRFTGELDAAVKKHEEQTGMIARALDSLQNSGRTLADKVLSKMTEEESYDFMQAMDTGDKAYFADKPVLRDIAAVIDSMFKGKVKEVESLGTGAMQNVRENYFPHIWEKDTDPAQVAKLMGNRPLEGSKGFSKERVFEDVQEGLDAGFKPVSQNPLDLVFLKMGELDKYITAHKGLQAMAESGLVHLLPAGEKAPEGYTDIAGKYGIVTKQSYQDTITGMPGEPKSYRYVAVDEVAQVFNNYLSPTLYQNKYIGNTFTGYMGVANWLNQFQLGVGSLFHGGFTSLEAVISRNALGLKALSAGDMKGAAEYFSTAIAAPVANWKLGQSILDAMHDGSAPRGEMKNVLDWLQLAGARTSYDERFRTNQTQKALESWANGKHLTAAVRTPLALVEQSSRIILEHIVPQQKLGVFAEMMKQWIDSNPNATHDQLRTAAQAKWSRADARLGQVVYERYFIHNAVKNGLQALIRAPGWTGGTIFEVGGGAKDALKSIKKLAKGEKVELSDRTAYTVSLIVTTAMANGLATLFFTGDLPKGTDFIAFRTGNLDERGKPERYVWPTYMKDLYAYANAPGKTLLHKAHPVIGLTGDVVKNRDYYGTEIRHPGDNPAKQLIDTVFHVGKAYIPFWTRGVAKERERGGSVAAQIAPFFGIMPAPADMNATSAEKIAREFVVGHMRQGTKTKEQFDRSQLRHQIENALRKKEPGAIKMIAQAKRDKLITNKDEQQIRKAAVTPPIVSMTRSLSWPEALQVWDEADKKERRLLKQSFITKGESYIEAHPDQVKETEKQLREIRRFVR